MANGKTMQAVVNLAGSIDPSLGKAIEQAQKKISGLNVKALAVGAAVGGIAVATGKAVIEAGKYMKDLGASFDDAADAIRIGTGATGDALDGLLDDFDAVYKSVPTTMEDASKAIADYNTRLGHPLRPRRAPAGSTACAQGSSSRTARSRAPRL